MALVFESMTSTRIMNCQVNGQAVVSFMLHGGVTVQGIHTFKTVSF